MQHHSADVTTENSKLQHPVRRSEENNGIPTHPSEPVCIAQKLRCQTDISHMLYVEFYFQQPNIDYLRCIQPMPQSSTYIIHCEGSKLCFDSRHYEVVVVLQVNSDLRLCNPTVQEKLSTPLHLISSCPSVEQTGREQSGLEGICKLGKTSVLCIQCVKMAN